MRKILSLIILLSFMLIYAEELDVKKDYIPNKYGWKNHEEQLEARKERDERQKLLQIYHLKKSSYTENMLKSAVFPGWGHLEANQATKGLILVGSEIVLLSTSYYFYDRSKEYYHKYQTANYIVDIKQYYNDASTQYRYSKIFFGLALTTWLYSIYDTIASTNDYNAEIWQKIIMEKKDRKLQVSPTGITWRF